MPILNQLILPVEGIALTCDCCLHDSVLNLKKCHCCNDELCDDCEKSVTDENLIVCETCKNENFCTCSQCDTELHNDNSFYCESNNNTYCESCYDELFTTCDCCSDRILINDTISENGIDICQSCRDNHYYNCDSCNDLVHSDDTYFCDDCQQSMCSHCHSDHSHESDKIDLDDHANELISIGSSAITDYHPDVNWQFKKHKTDLNSNPYFGVELEILTPNDHATCKMLGNSSLNGNIICSHDGSLRGKGFEIVFTPHKRQAFKKLNMKNVLKSLQDLNCRSYEGALCGIHVHIEKQQFFYKRKLHYSNAQIFQKLFNLMQSDLLKFSKRTSEQVSDYCSFLEGRHNRYYAVNLTNDETIEIRLWRGTLDHKRFNASILMSLALVDYLKTHSAMQILRSDYSGVKRSFTEFIKRSGEYQSLVKFLNEKRLFN